VTTARDPSKHQHGYEAVPYRSLCFESSHPARAHTVATIFHAAPAPIENSRILELGCGAGANLVAIAIDLPKSSCLGVDFSKTHIDSANNLSAELELKNLRFQQADFRELDPSLGSFDYIIAHGIYTWVPKDVQLKILELVRACLAPNGVAYLSYNTYPGWHEKQAARSLMLFHSQNLDEPQQAIEQSLEILKFVSASVQEQKSPYAKGLRAELKTAQKTDRSHFFHDQLATFNEPVYFSQFAKQAGEHGLQYLAEVKFGIMQPLEFPPEVQNALRQISGDLIQTEQYLDFLRNRSFRETLLCREEIKLVRQLTADRIMAFHIASTLRPASQALDLNEGVVVRFESPGTNKFAEVSDALIKAVLAVLHRAWPETLPFDELVREATQLAEEHLSPEARNEGALKQKLASFVFELYFRDMVIVRPVPGRATQTVSEKPIAHSFARIQAKRGTQVTNTYHMNIELGDLNRAVLSLLDGTRDKAALTREVESQVQPTTQRAKQVPIEEAVEESLASLSQYALLVG
jgi:methyltransferase-like protein/trans-aconitate methyltransferase